MKNFIPTFLFILFGLITFAQDIPKKANVIVISKNTKSLDYLIKFAKYLQSEGYPVEEINKDLQSVKTGYKKFKWGGTASLSIYAYAEEYDSTSNIRITGRIEFSSFLELHYEEACNCGSIGVHNVTFAGFKTLDELVRKFEYDLIQYEVK
jgi:hypothetical protein